MLEKVSSLIFKEVVTCMTSLISKCLSSLSKSVHCVAGCCHVAVKGGNVLEALSALVTEMSFFLYDGTDDTDVVVLIERLGALCCRTLPCFQLSRAAASLRRSSRSST